jgi:hypothetical protein
LTGIGLVASIATPPTAGLAVAAAGAPAPAGPPAVAGVADVGDVVLVGAACGEAVAAVVAGREVCAGAGEVV